MSSHQGPSNPADRRKSKRHAVGIALEISIGRDRVIQATANLSMHGVFLHRAIPYPVGTRCLLKLLLPDGQPPIACEGEVVNIPNARDTGMGLNFVSIAQSDQQRIEAFGSSLG